MFRKLFITLLFTAALLCGGIVAMAQSEPVSGRIVTKSADGKPTGLPGALVELYRIDIVGVGSAAKTDKNGNFQIGGLLLQGTYALAVSAPNFAPQIVPGIKAGAEGIQVTLVPGDGSKLTEDQVR